LNYRSLCINIYSVFRFNQNILWNWRINISYTETIKRNGYDNKQYFVSYLYTKYTNGTLYTQNLSVCTVPTERNLKESEHRADRPSALALGLLGRTPERTPSKPRANAFKIFTSGPSKLSQVRYCVIEMSIKVVVNWLDNGVMELK
jgi:hypothetical protein